MMIADQAVSYASILDETRRLLRESVANGGKDFRPAPLAERLKDVVPSIAWTGRFLEAFISGRNLHRFQRDEALSLEDLNSLYAFAAAQREQVAKELEKSAKVKVALNNVALPRSGKIALTFNLVSPGVRQLASNPDFLQAAQEALRAVVRAYAAGADLKK